MSDQFFRRRVKVNLEKFDQEFQNRFQALTDIDPGFRDSNKLLIPQPFGETRDLKVNNTNVEIDIDSFITDIVGKWGSHWLELNRVNFSLRFEGNTIQFGQFGTGSALSNGIKMNYTFNENKVLLIEKDPIVDNGSWFEIDPDTQINSGSAATNVNVIASSIALDEFTRLGCILDLDNGDKFTIEVNDDLTTYTSITKFKVRFRGTAYLRK